MRLKEVAVRNAKSGPKPRKLNDGNGLYLLLHPNGSKYWQFRYRFLDKEKVLSLGIYPEVSLQAARIAREQAKAVLRSGSDPSSERKLKKRRARLETENRFEMIAVEWLKQRSHIWTARHSAKVRRRLEQDIFKELGEMPIAQIKPTDLLMALRKIESRGVNYTAHRTQQIVGQIFRYAVACGKAERDISADLRGALQPVRKSNYSRLSANELPEFLGALRTYDGDRQTKNAVKLLLLTFVRTVELRAALWKEFDLEKAEWRIPAERMKMRSEHVVPLSRQAVELFKAQQEISGGFEHVFPNRNRPTVPMSENTILYSIYRIGYHNRTTAHGFRGTASTILHENGFNTEVIERQLAHRDRNTVRASYNFATYLPERRVMMQWWSDYLERASERPST